MRLRPKPAFLVLAVLALTALVQAVQTPAAQDDPVLKKILEIGTTDNQVMSWIDIASNRFGGRYTGTDAYNNAAAWAVWQFKQWGIQAALDEAGEMPVGFNRGPWFGKMVKPAEKSLYFGTPSMTSGTKGVQRGPVAICPVAIDPSKEKEAEAVKSVEAVKDKFKGAWVLIPGESNGIGRDGRRNAAMSAVTKIIYEAGALGTVQMSKEPVKMLDSQIAAWDQLPVLPDIKLVDKQYDEIKALVEQGQTVELEFDIRNWFKMGPVKYHSVVAWIPGTTYPDEYVIMGGHLDCFDSATGGVDDGSGFSVGMEALRILAAAGAKPKRSVMTILFAAEEMGILGAQAWLKNNPEKAAKTVLLMNRDGSPSAITGAAVLPGWYPDFVRITEPLKNLNPTWPFELVKSDYPRAKSERPSGTDASVFTMQGIPTLSLQTKTDYNYGRAWHTLLDLYSEVIPYTEHQKHSALVTAVIAYGVANLDKPLTRDGFYLPDGLYADITTTQGRIMTTLDFVNAPLAAAQFIRIVEPQTPAGGPAPQGRPMMPPMGGPGGERQAPPAIGKFLTVSGGVATGTISSNVQKAAAGVKLPKTTNSVLKHNTAGILGLSAENAFYLTLKPKSGLDKASPAIGKVIGGADVLMKLKKNDEVRSIRITRVGQAAKDFKTDDESFKKLLEKGK